MDDKKIDDKKQVEQKPEATDTKPEKRPEPQEAKYTDQQVNDLIAKSVGKAEAKATEAILKELGLTKAEELAELKKLRQESMSEAEKKEAELKAKEAELEEARKEADKVRLEADALRAGIPADKVDRAVKLASMYEGENKIAEVLKEFPEFAKAGVNVSQKTSGQTKTETETLLEQARKAAGLIS